MCVEYFPALLKTLSLLLYLMKVDFGHVVSLLGRFTLIKGFYFTVFSLLLKLVL